MVSKLRREHTGRGGRTISIEKHSLFCISSRTFSSLEIILWHLPVAAPEKSDGARGQGVWRGERAKTFVVGPLAHCPPDCVCDCVQPGEN